MPNKARTLDDGGLQAAMAFTTHLNAPTTHSALKKMLEALQACFKPWAWLLAPSWPNVLFAVRTTAAALLALGLAMYMELDSPGWTCITVWAVAAPSRGETVSKARWRLMGTALGTTMALTFTALLPQAPWLFFPTLAGWAGICAGMSTLSSNFRAYAWSLSGYTCAIIALDAAPNANHVFSFACGRATYVVLGIVCEAILGSVFSIDRASQALRATTKNLQNILSGLNLIIRDVMINQPGTEDAMEREIGAVITLGRRLEFAGLEMGPYTHAIDHARAMLAAVMMILTRCFGLALRLRALGRGTLPDHPITAALQQLLAEAKMDLLHGDVAPLLADIRQVRSLCAQDHLTSDETPEARVIRTGLADMLGDLELAIAEFSAIEHARPHVPEQDKFRFKHALWRDPVQALSNGVRAFLVVLASALIYEVTSWSMGMRLVTMVSVISCLFAPRDDARAGSFSFVKGTICATLAGWLLVFVLLPMTSVYEAYALALGSMMVLGGLARANPATADAAAAYGFMLTLVYSPNNQMLTNELQYFNMASALIASALMSFMAFHIIWPFDTRVVLKRALRHIILDVVHLASAPMASPIAWSSRLARRRALQHAERVWIMHGMDRFARIANRLHAQGTYVPLQLQADILNGTLAALTLGMNVMRLKSALQPITPALPPAVVARCKSLLRALAALGRFRTRPQREAALLHAEERAVAATKAAQNALEVETQPLVRRTLTDILAACVLIETLLKSWESFFKVQYSLVGPAPITP
ncbi:FUSC family protein [Formicincola oecophyllae]|uniref:FUSC family protein n=1 Tax=Formicincola oecophyllae TaxID=2558361 RepID=A0A4Y6U9H7_9PROT|nr:FUSC family protein [Formicincola oecophyllae]QDH13208.1 FUSC family protein [Formicincola oecophyllae]